MGLSKRTRLDMLFTSYVTYVMLCSEIHNGYGKDARYVPSWKVHREEAPTAASAPTNKKRIPLASLYWKGPSVSRLKVHVPTTLTVAKACSLGVFPSTQLDDG